MVQYEQYNPNTVESKTNVGSMFGYILPQPYTQKINLMARFLLHNFLSRNSFKIEEFVVVHPEFRVMVTYFK